ncbi:hypothetical protein SMACR_06551 [Sordaria macrospora]|uniref:WGS project CABT00000000 data, contig 2.28 n=2 Tax=Sordaria macrospora TaxID=5147 RepID=F7W4N5_SORMK|nr:uncharacterized protein SMAC_06551 [Sordaria macrospora k-hell]KAA8633707.1 hypothetical protein SMACR_06551 [Sordaria macrospora]KAH7633480.1 hypothetical protein B0T09DRAFT_92520 [Sordaria sp. MPI-SDFR-AT-0083]WPJ60123.1 hypothetical protein SMAC4_06551 [Sordaria macrospora]CCC12472.1 unnamed protein product [Sordaria macrospora k-hell]
MAQPGLPIEALPAWALLNGITFPHVKVANIEGKGFGVVSDGELKPEVPLMTVPNTLVLNVKAVDEYAKEDKNFKQLLDAVGHHSARRDILLFLLVQLVLASKAHQAPVGVSNPWTEYIKFLPKTVLVPTLWTEDERLLLRGTSLESAVNAKMTALTAEFDAVREAASSLPTWNDVLWPFENGNSPASLRNWILLDALYRSRVLELPKSGESMVPCIDMINHSTCASAYYDENTKDEVILLPRPDRTISSGKEVTISYGDAKPAAEMLFSYGFIDPETTVESLVLPLEPFGDDPLEKAKLFAFKDLPKVHVAHDKGSSAVSWDSPFAYLMCVNEEDGLDFRVLQDSEGGRQLRVFWREEDVTDRIGDFETLTESHEVPTLIKLRVVTVVQERLQQQLERAQSFADLSSLPTGDVGLLRDECQQAASLLRSIETGLLEVVIEYLEKERRMLLADENVVAYLGSMETVESDLVGEEASNEPEDFS